MSTQYLTSWLVENHYLGMTEAEIDKWEELKREREKEERIFTKHFFRKIFADCKTCNPPPPPGIVKLDREAVLVKVDMLDLLSRYTTVRHGPRPVALCIWHNEKNPSMAIYPESKRVWCFSQCGQGGTAFDIVMEKEGTDFVGAMHLLNNLYP